MRKETIDVCCLKYSYMKMFLYTCSTCLSYYNYLKINIALLYATNVMTEACRSFVLCDLGCDNHFSSIFCILDFCNYSHTLGRHGNFPLIALIDE